MDIDKIPICPYCGEMLAQGLIKPVDGKGQTVIWMCQCTYKDEEGETGGQITSPWINS